MGEALLLFFGFASGTTVLPGPITPLACGKPNKLWSYALTVSGHATLSVTVSVILLFVWLSVFRSLGLLRSPSLVSFSMVKWLTRPFASLMRR